MNRRVKMTCKFSSGRQRLGAAVLLVTLPASCGSGHDSDSADGQVDQIMGIVVDVQGVLTATDSITIRQSDGRETVFVPAPEATFHGGPFSHIRDHLLSGLPVVVDYETDPRSGDLIAVYAEDA